MVSARVESMAVSPICTVQVGAVDIDAGQMRAIELDAHDVGVGRVRELGAADGVAWFAVSALRSMSALESNTIHSVSARLNTAAAVGVVNANDSFRLAPWRVSSAATLPLVLAARGRGGGASLA